MVKIVSSFICVFKKKSFNGIKTIPTPKNNKVKEELVEENRVER